MIHTVFPHTVYKTNINKDISFHIETLNEAKKTLDDTVSMSTGIDIHNAGYTSVQKRYWINSPTYGLEFKNPAFKEIFDFIDKCVEEYIDALEIEKTYIDVKQTCSYLNWCDSTMTGIHDHEGSFISYTYYFYLEGELPELFFIDPIASNRSRYPWNNLRFKGNKICLKIKPDIGDLLLFPGYLLHGTDNQYNANKKFSRYLFNGDYHVYSNSIPNFPSLSVDQDSN